MISYMVSSHHNQITITFDLNICLRSEVMEEEMMSVSYFLLWGNVSSHTKARTVTGAILQCQLFILNLAHKLSDPKYLFFLWKYTFQIPEREHIQIFSSLDKKKVTLKYVIHDPENTKLMHREKKKSNPSDPSPYPHPMYMYILHPAGWNPKPAYCTWIGFVTREALRSPEGVNCFHMVN